MAGKATTPPSYTQTAKPIANNPILPLLTLGLCKSVLGRHAGFRTSLRDTDQRIPRRVRRSRKQKELALVCLTAQKFTAPGSTGAIGSLADAILKKRDNTGCNLVRTSKLLNCRLVSDISFSLSDCKFCIGRSTLMAPTKDKKLIWDE